MRIVNKKIVLASILLVVVTTGVLICGLHSDKETQLDSVNLKEVVNNEMFAIMLEQSDGTYKESADNTWPTEGYAYDSSKSGCVDVNGNKLDGVLNFDTTNNLASVNTTSTSYCYLYFSLPPNLYKLCSEYNNINECAINENLEDVTGIWNSTLESDGYRYVGTNPDNYICFGTNNTEECTSDTDKYMYRIIGIFEDESGVQHLKLIKKEALNTAYKWNANYLNNVAWDSSDVYKGINGSYYLSNTTEYPYMADTTWTDKIITWDYIATNTKTRENYSANGSYGVYYNNYNTVKTIYLHEMNRDSKVNETCYYDESTIVECSVGEWNTTSVWDKSIVTEPKIGLMYLSDYLLSLGESALEYKSSDNRTTLETGWMHLNNNDTAVLSTTETAPPDTSEWTMSRYGSHYGSYTAWNVGDNGGITFGRVDALISVRPVFYTITDTKLSGGSGTITNPYLIAS